MFDTTKYENFDYRYFLSRVPSFLSLDISKNSTGVTLWVDNELMITHFSLKGIDNDIQMLRAFEKKLLEILNGRYVEYIIIEGTIGSINHITAKTLYMLNIIPDNLADLGHIQVGQILRPDNKEWKSWLKQASGYTSKVRAEVHTKQVTQNCIKLLGYREEFKTDDESDSFGMALGTIYAKVLDMATKSSAGTKTKQEKLQDDVLKGYDVKQYDNFDAMYKEVQKYTDLYQADLTNEKSEFRKYFKTLVNNIGDDKVFVFKVPTTKLGILIIKMELNVHIDTSYLIVIKKGIKRAKMKK